MEHDQIIKQDEEGITYYCEICDMLSYISEDTPYGTCQCS